MVVVAAVAAVVGASPGAVANGGSFPGSNGRLLFIRFERGFTYAYTSRADGSAARRIVKADFATWSPNGRRIAYADADRGMIGIVAASGESPQLINDGIDPTWSPKGDELAFVAYPARRPEIFVLRLDARIGPRQLTAGGGEKFQPSWSPDGSLIAYAVSYDGRNADDIFAVSPAGGEPRQLTSGPALDSEPSWSPNGRMLLFTRRVPGQPAHIYSLDLTTSAVRQITADAHADGSAVWSPDGRRIAFSRYVDGQTRLWLVDADGSEEHQVAGSVAGDYLADWQRTIDLAVRQHIRPRGRHVSIALTIVNRSPGPASAVTLFNRLPSGARVIAKPRPCAIGPRVVCRLGTLPASGTRMVTLLVSPPRRRGNNRASVTGLIVDPNSANNAAVVPLGGR